MEQLERSGTWSRWGATGPRRIVIAEDNREIRRLIAAAMIRDGYVVEEASDGPKLLILVIEADPPVDLVISDHRMAVSSGLQVLAGLRDAGWTCPSSRCQLLVTRICVLKRPSWTPFSWRSLSSWRPSESLYALRFVAPKRTRSQACDQGTTIAPLASVRESMLRGRSCFAPIHGPATSGIAYGNGDAMKLRSCRS